MNEILDKNTCYNFFLDEENLDRLTLDRFLKTSEIFEPNDYYGQASILKNYLGLPMSYSLKATFEHGVEFNDNFIWSAELEANLPTCIVLDERRLNFYKEKSNKLVFPIGFGFIYAIDLFKKLYGPLYTNKNKMGTIVFPAHSTHYIRTSFDFKGYAEYLEKLDERFKPIVICIYWKDYLSGHHVEFQKKGFKIITAGHMFDNLFMLRMVNICSQFKYANSNQIGTHVPISIKSGCLFFLTEEFIVNLEHNSEVPISNIPDSFMKKYLPLFNEKNILNYELQLSFADEYLGTKFKKSRFSLYLIFIISEIFDKLRVDFKNKGLNILPPFWRPNRIIPFKLRKLINFFKMKFFGY